MNRSLRIPAADRKKPAHRTDLPCTTRWLGWPAYRRVDALTGACFGLRRTVWQQLGGFDEGFLNGSEDIDLALRATAAGFTHYIALRSVVRHHISASAGRNLRNGVREISISAHKATSSTKLPGVNSPANIRLRIFEATSSCKELVTKRMRPFTHSSVS